MSYPLQQLRDIHLGAPPAEGWFSGYGSLLLGLFVVFALTLNSLLHSSHRSVVRRRANGEIGRAHV